MGVTPAIGGNEEAARLAGVPVVRTKIIIFVLSGLVSAIAGIILASRMTSGQPMTSIGYELIVISACVLGGVSLKGGIGKISYVVAGILILGTVENAMNLLNISPFAQYVVRGLILLAAVIFDRYKQKRNALSDAFFHNNLTFFPPQPAATTVGCSSLQMATPVTLSILTCL